MKNENKSQKHKIIELLRDTRNDKMLIDELLKKNMELQGEVINHSREMLGN